MEMPPKARTGCLPWGLVNKNRTSLKYDSEALNEVLFSFLFTNLENSTSFRASESYFNEVPFLFTSPLGLLLTSLIGGLDPMQICKKEEKNGNILKDVFAIVEIKFFARRPQVCACHVFRA